jgi:chlorophyllide a oxygenase
MELPVEHGLLLDNLLDLAHAPFTHTSTFAKGWSVPRLVWFIHFKREMIPCVKAKLIKFFKIVNWLK